MFSLAEKEQPSIVLSGCMRVQFLAVLGKYRSAFFVQDLT